MKKVKTEKVPVEPVQPRLYRSEVDKVIAGVCGGLAEYFNVDAVIIRLIFVIFTVVHGIGIVIYGILWILIPSKSQSYSNPHENMRANVEEMKVSAHKFTQGLQTDGHSTRKFIGALLLLVGILYIFRNFGFFNYDFHQFWPVILIVIGLYIITNGRHK